MYFTKYFKTLCQVSNLRQVPNWGAFFSISKKTWIPGSPSIPQFFPVMGFGWHTLSPMLNISRSGADCLSPNCPSLYNLIIWLSEPFSLPFIRLTSWSPGLLTLPLPLLTLLTWPGSGSCSLWTLPGVSASGDALPHTTNFLFHHT